MRPLDKYMKNQLDAHMQKLERLLSADVMSIISPLLYGLEGKVRDAIAPIRRRKQVIAIIHDTSGGLVEVVERMVNIIRANYREVIFIIPDRAMSAGTIFALSADRILMDCFSCLGPIDPQIEKEGRLVPALSYLNQYERLNDKAAKGALTSAEYALLSKMDLGELYQFEQARELSRELLVKWLSNYKFKNWKTTETNKTVVTQQMKEDQANRIAELLSNNERWHTHGRGINRDTLINEIGLKIEDFSEMPRLSTVIREYFELLRDYMLREQMTSFVHTRGYF